MGKINEKAERALAAKKRDAERTLIYVLLTECVTGDRGVSQPFISEKFHSAREPFDNTAELSSLKEIIDFFAYGHFVPVYDAQNISASIVPDMPGAPRVHVSGKTRIQARLKTMGFADKEDFEVKNHPSCSFDGSPVTGTVLSHIVARKAIGNSVALLNLGGFVRRSPVVYIDDIHSSQKVAVSVISEIKTLHVWLADNRNPRRKYTFNPKHGDSNNNARGGSQLKTSPEETDRLLRFAVGNDRKSALWYYDDDRGEYIYFENQNEFPPNFHGYHVKKGEENYDNINFDKLRKVQKIP